MNLMAGCKDKLTYFRIKELKDVLTQLGLSKQGKKQDLVDRILGALSGEQARRLGSKKNAVGREEVAKLVDDTFRKMQAAGGNDLASKGPVCSDGGNMKVKGEMEDPYRSDIKVRCLCGSSLETESMIKCEDPRCQVWQHIACVIIPDKPVEGSPAVPDVFYCELCRLSRADPFWLTVSHPLYPVKLTATIPNDGSNPMMSVDRTFQLSRQEKDMLAKQEVDVQAWCMLLNDKVQFRMQWLLYADLQVNGVAVRAINRPGSQMLGTNGRDDGPIITTWTKDGINKILLTGCDARIFCFGVRTVRRRGVHEIWNMIPKESDGEPFEVALARVCRCIGGGTGADDADSDSDIEVIADFFCVNLRCPLSGARIKKAGRFRPCAHMLCFDLDVLLEVNQRCRKWQCPVCLKNYSLEHLIIDPYFNRIASKMSHCGEDVTEIEVKSDGSWRVKSKNECEQRELGDLIQWHLPDGSLCPSNIEVKPNPDALMQVKQEARSEGHTGLKLEIRKNRNGFWEFSKPDETNTISSGNQFGEYQEKHVIPMSSSATGSGREGEDNSVNQDAVGTFDFANNGIELDSLNAESAYEFGVRNQNVFSANQEIIVLSDSDEENDVLISSGPTYGGSRADDVVNFAVPPSGIVENFQEDPVLGAAGNSCLGLFNGNDDDFALPLWQLPPGSQGGSGFQLFTSDPEIPDPMVDLQHGAVTCSSTMTGFGMAPRQPMATTTLIPGPVGRSEGEVNDGLVDNPLPFSRNDPSLQIFLPARPSDAPVQSDPMNQADVSDDWISLSLGDSVCGNQVMPASINGMSSNQQMPQEDASANVNETASLLLEMNDGRSERSSRQRLDSPFSFPRQKRSVRPKLDLSINPGSEW